MTRVLPLALMLLIGSSARKQELNAFRRVTSIAFQHVQDTAPTRHTPLKRESPSPNPYSINPLDARSLQRIDARIISYRRFSTRRFQGSETSSETVVTNTPADSFFAASGIDFASLGVINPVLLERLGNLGLTRPTAVQAAAFKEISSGKDMTIGAETGSGKTLAYLLPLMNDILQRKQQEQQSDQQQTSLSYDYARALILVPNKELVQQVIRMALPLAGGLEALVYGADKAMLATASTPINDPTTDDKNSIVRIAVMPGGLNEPQDFPPFRKAMGLAGRGEEPPVDLIVSTPAAVGPLGLSPKNIDMFADIETLVIDEADMLLDGGYIRALENVLLGFKRADRLDASLNVKKTQHIFVAATLPDFGLRSVDAFLQRKFPAATRITMADMHKARHSGLVERTRWILLDSKKERMQQLVKLLQTPSTEGGLQDEKVMVFLNSVEDVESATQALERAGCNAVSYHAKKSLDERTAALDGFRRYHKTEKDIDDTTSPILVCTDLASRGLDVPGVHAVVQLQFAGNVVAHLHRMGRCGRAGQRDGRGIVFYGEKEKALVDVVQQAEDEQERMVLPGDVLEIDDETAVNVKQEPTGTVKQAFSRKRGFTKKLKKLHKKSSDNYDN